MWIKRQLNVQCVSREELQVIRMHQYVLRVSLVLTTHYGMNAADVIESKGFYIPCIDTRKVQLTFRLQAGPVIKGAEITRNGV